ncbi:MAG: (2,3-dihydroxybenzoyl)adenylate synthase [bacterium]
MPWPKAFVERYRARGYWGDRPLGVVLADAVAHHHDRLALVFKEQRVSHGEMGRRIERLARSLLDLNIKPLDRVLLQLPNWPAFIYLYFALVRVGAIPVMALLPHRQREIRHFLELTEAVGYAVPGTFGRFHYPAMAEEMRREVPTLRHVFVAGGPHSEGCIALDAIPELVHTQADLEARSASLDPMEPVVFQLSGGTTGLPKIIPRTHNDYAYNSLGFAMIHRMDAESVLLVVLPIAHNFALASPGIQGCLFNGGRVVLSESPRADAAFPLIERERITHLELVPALLIQWLHDPTLQDYDVSSVRVINTGGQKLQPEVKRLAQRRFTGAVVQEVFGMAEGLLCSPRLDDPEEVLIETVGRPMSPDDEVRLVDENERDVPEGEIGELICRGPYTLRGYYKAPEYNTQAFTAEGYYKSGDLMRRHPSGNLIVEGRKKDLINRGGEKISAEEVENLILTHAAVKNVACVAFPDPVLGERMCACVVLKSDTGLRLDELCAFLLEQGIAKFKLPERLEHFDELPLVPGFNKVSKRALRDLLAQRLQIEAR